MNKSAMVRARIEPRLKDQVEDVFHRLGLSATEAVTLFYKQVVLRQGLPFEVSIPNDSTMKTFAATDAGKDVVVCKDAKALYSKLGI